MKKGLEVLFGIALIIAALCIISPECRGLFKKHIPVIGHEVVNMTEDLAGVGMDTAQVNDEGREVANRVVNDVTDIADAGFDYFATEDNANIQRASQAADDLLLLGMDGFAKAFEEVFMTY